MRRTFEWRIVLGLALVFLAGVATGLFAGAWHAHRAFGERHGPMMGERMREHMKRQLDLTPEQEQVVDPILRTAAERLQVIRTETGQRVEQVMKDAHRELGTHLTPAQVAKLEQMRKRHEHFRRYRREGRHPPPPEAP